MQLDVIQPEPPPAALEAGRAADQDHAWRRLVISATLGGVLLVVAMTPMLAHMLPAGLGGHAIAAWFAKLGLTGRTGHWEQFVLATPIVFWGGWPILSGGTAAGVACSWPAHRLGRARAGP